MKGKIIFVTGAAVGYVLGTRAGRKRYEQIKSGAICVWNSKPVQNGVSQAQGFVADTVGDVPQQIISAGRRAVAKMIGPDEAKKPAPASRAADGSKVSSASVTTTVAKTSTAQSTATKPKAKPKAKSTSTKSTAAKSAAKTTPSDD